MKFITKGKSLIKNGQYEYPITFQLIKDGRKNKVLSKKIRSKIKVTMVHGKKMKLYRYPFQKSSFGVSKCTKEVSNN